MEFVEEEARPRLIFQSRAFATASSPSPNPETLAVSKLHVALCFSLSSLLLSAVCFSFQSQTLTFLLVWISLSLLVGPFAPASVTGGNVHVGVGEILEPSDPDPLPEQVEESKKRNPGRRHKARRSDDLPPNAAVPPLGPMVSVERTDQRNSDPMLVGNGGGGGGGGGEEEEKEWNPEDFEILKKQMSKHPVGTARRWELISEAFQGRHRVETVIRTAKSLSERRPGTGDSFTQFLRQRKPLDKRAEAVNGELSEGVLLENGESHKGDAGESVNWSSGEDIALLNALKAFPKDVSMRWEKIVAAVPGKSKTACMKRVAELKRDFRSSKAS